MAYEESKELFNHILNNKNKLEEINQEMPFGDRLYEIVLNAAKDYARQYGSGSFGEIFSDEDLILVSQFFKDHFVRNRIYNIALELEPHFDEVENHFTKEEFDDWFKKKEEYAKRLRTYCPEIATLTENPEDNIALALGAFTTKGEPASPEFIKNVARYYSFNSDLWSKNSGTYKEPDLSDDEITEMPSFSKFKRLMDERIKKVEKARSSSSFVDPTRIERGNHKKLK